MINDESAHLSTILLLSKFVTLTSGSLLPLHQHNQLTKWTVELNMEQHDPVAQYAVSSLLRRAVHTCLVLAELHY